MNATAMRAPRLQVGWPLVLVLVAAQILGALFAAWRLIEDDTVLRAQDLGSGHRHALVPLVIAALAMAGGAAGAAALDDVLFLPWREVAAYGSQAVAATLRGYVVVATAVLTSLVALVALVGEPAGIGTALVQMLRLAIGLAPAVVGLTAFGVARGIVLGRPGRAARATVLFVPLITLPSLVLTGDALGLFPFGPFAVAATGDPGATVTPDAPAWILWAAPAFFVPGLVLVAIGSVALARVRRRPRRTPGSQGEQLRDLTGW